VSWNRATEEHLNGWKIYNLQIGLREPTQNDIAPREWQKCEAQRMYFPTSLFLHHTPQTTWKLERKNSTGPALYTNSLEKQNAEAWRDLKRSIETSQETVTRAALRNPKMDGTLRIRVITGSCSDPESWVLLIFLP
jgi:hypothetical protein